MPKTYIADEQTAGAMARSMLSWRLTQPNNVFIYLMLLVLAALFSLYWRQPVIVLIFLAILALGEYANYKKIKINLAQNIAKPGNKITVSVTDTELNIATNQGGSKSSLRLYKSVSTKRNFVILKSKSSVVIILPKQLISNAELKTIERALKAS